MFQDETAWFSSSVDMKEQKEWVDNGGTVVTQDIAMFLFSCDTSDTDTIKIHESDAYINEHISIIHPLYITDCVKAGNRESVTLMEYNFPPAEVVRATEGKVCYKWKKSTHSSSKQYTADTVCPDHKKNPTLPSSTAILTTSAKDDLLTIDYQDIESLPKVTGPMQYLFPGQNGFEVHAIK